MMSYPTFVEVVCCLFYSYGGISCMRSNAPKKAIQGFVKEGDHQEVALPAVKRICTVLFLCVVAVYYNCKTSFQ